VSASLVYEDDLVQLWHGDYRDNLDVLRGLDVDAIITDPPYGDTNLRWDSWPAGWVADAASISRAMWCYGSFRMFHDHATDFAAWKYSQDVVWAKQNGTGLLTDRFRRIHEHAVFWYQGDWASIHHDPQFTYDARRKVVRKSAKPAHLHGATDAVTYTREEGGPRLMTSLIEARNEHGRGIHPTQKPLAAIMPLVEYSVPRGGLVVDLFAGSATTALAARMTGRRCIAFEAHKPYALAAAQRLSQQSFDLEAAGA
jgi:site-specific DNA-methyltransferase (adenine-specific)